MVSDTTTHALYKGTGGDFGISFCFLWYSLEFCLPLLALSVTAAAVLFRGFSAVWHEPARVAFRQCGTSPPDSLSGSVALLEEDEEEDV